jgi:hypothetical protein
MLSFIYTDGNYEVPLVGKSFYMLFTPIKTPFIIYEQSMNPLPLKFRENIYCSKRNDI